MLNEKLCEELTMGSFLRQINKYGDVTLLREKTDRAIVRVSKDASIAFEIIRHLEYNILKHIPRFFLL